MSAPIQITFGKVPTGAPLDIPKMQHPQGKDAAELKAGDTSPRYRLAKKGMNGHC